MGKKIFLTGAAGFIGFHVALALKNRGDEVVGLDNFNDYYSLHLKRQRASLLEAEGIEVIEGDINDPTLVDSIFKLHRFTDVCHLAAQAGVRYARSHPQAYLSSNIDGFLSLLQQLRSSPHVKLTYASSSSVYGLNTKTPFSESDPTDCPANLYAATKKANELMAFSYHHLYGIRMTGLRFFTVYGPWGRPDMAYFAFTKAILAKEPIHLFNRGEMERDFTYIDDIVRGTLAAIDYEGEYDLFNLGNHTPVALLDFVATLEKLLGQEARKVFEGESAGEVRCTYADITHAREKLGYTPRVDLEEGLTKFLDWYLKAAGSDSMISLATRL